MDRRGAGKPLPSLDADVDKGWIELDHAGAVARPFHCDQGRAGAAEGIENQTSTVGAVAHRVGDHGDRLDGRMKAELALCATGQCILAGIVPDIGPVSAMSSELDVVDVPACSDLIHKDELMF